MNNESLISFSPLCPLIGHRDRSGFRLNTEKVDFNEALNFLSDNFDEGYEIEGAIGNDRWQLRDGYRYFSSYEKLKRWGVRLIVYEKEILDAFMKKFKLSIPMDNSNTIEHYINEAIAPLRFSKLNSKRDRKLKHNIAETLNIIGHKVQWYDINYNWDTQMVSFNVKNTDVEVRL